MADKKNKQKYHIFVKYNKDNESQLAMGLNFKENAKFTVKKHHNGGEKDTEEAKEDEQETVPAEEKEDKFEIKPAKLPGRFHQ